MRPMEKETNKRRGKASCETCKGQGKEKSEAPGWNLKNETNA
jgi:hypothetical protein